MSERFKALKADGPAKMDFWSKDQPKCPHCGDDFDIQEREAWNLYDEGDHEVTCANPLCGREFTVSVEVTYSFSTCDQPDEDEEDDATTPGTEEPRNG